MAHRYAMNSIDDLDTFIAQHYPRELVMTLQPSDDDGELLVFREDELDATKEQIEQGRDLLEMVPADIAGRLGLYRKGEKVTEELHGTDSD